MCSVPARFSTCVVATYSINVLTCDSSVSCCVMCDVQSTCKDVVERPLGMTAHPSSARALFGVQCLRFIGTSPSAVINHLEILIMCVV